MGRIYVILCVLVGCGRVGFDGAGDHSDALPDGMIRTCAMPTDHDEDADTIDDACDNCPWVANPTQTNDDGDPVGPGCDPHPSVDGDAITLFDPFTGDTGWRTDEGAVLDGDEMFLPGEALVFYSSITRPFTPGSQTLIWGGSVSSTSDNDGNPQHVTLDVGTDDGSQTFYCELIRQANGDVGVQLSWTNGSGGYDGGPLASVGSALAGGTGTLEMTIDGLDVECRGRWNGSIGISSGTPPLTTIQREVMRIGAQNATAHLSYFARIASP